MVLEPDPYASLQGELDELVDDFRRCIYLFHNSAITWSKYTDVGSGKALVKPELKAFYTSVELFARKHQSHPDLRLVLSALIQEVDQFDIKDIPIGRMPEYLTQSYVELEPGSRDFVLKKYRMRLADRLQALISDLPKKAKPGAKKISPALAERFPVPNQFEFFHVQLLEHGILDHDGNFKPQKGNKGKLLGAYEGSAKALGFATGDYQEMARTLNAAFPTLELSKGRPHEPAHTKGHSEMKGVFHALKWPIR